MLWTLNLKEIYISDFVDILISNYSTNLLSLNVFLDFFSGLNVRVYCVVYLRSLFLGGGVEKMCSLY